MQLKSDSRRVNGGGRLELVGQSPRLPLGQSGRNNPQDLIVVRLGGRRRVPEQGGPRYEDHSFAESARIHGRKSWCESFGASRAGQTAVGAGSRPDKVALL